MTGSAAVSTSVHHVITCTLKRQKCVKKIRLGDDLEQQDINNSHVTTIPIMERQA
jgi:hypothetical protein